MVVLGIILLLVGYLVPTTVASLLITVGWILVVVGAVMWLLGSMNRPVAGRRYWY